MKTITLLESTKITSSNTHRTVMIKTLVDVDGEEQEFTWGHCHVEKTSTNVPSSIYIGHIDIYDNDIVGIVKY